MSFRYHHIYYNKIVRNCNFNFVTSVGRQFNALQRQNELLTLQISVQTDKPVIIQVFAENIWRIFGL